MKRKDKKSKSGKQRMPFKKTIELSQEMVEDKEVYNLRVMKKKKSKDEVCGSSKTPQRNLRTRAVKNYSEVPSTVNFKPEENEVDKKSPVIESGKRIPIYKTIVLFEEKVKNPEEIYEFIDDLQASDQKVKKKKKSLRKASLKRVKGLTGYDGSRKGKTKSTKVISKNVLLKEQEKQPITEAKPNVKHSIYANIKIPEHLQNAGDSTIAEASTIIILDQTVQQSDRASPNNSVTFQTNTQDSNMSNHPLVRQSMSPITKEVDNLFIGSPRRSIDTGTFSQVQKVVQSTPQINRVLAGQEKKPLVQMNLNQSICSEDAVHLSFETDEKLTQQKPTNNIIQVEKENVSPRKFRTVIRNLNSMETITTSSVKQASLQQTRQSPLKVVLPSTSFENNENDQEIQDDILPTPSILTVDNRKDSNTLSPNKSSKIKIDQLLGPLRFENTIQSFEQIVSSESKSNTDNSNSQKENENPDLAAEPSGSKKPKAVVLRQSNLNNFLNLDEMPESTRISTIHGIFDDVSSTPINGKKSQAIFEESSIEKKFENWVNSERSSPVKKKSVPIIATARDVARSVKGKLFLKARVKSSLTKKIPENMIKKTLLKNILKKTAPEPKAPVNEEIIEESDVEKEKSKIKSHMDNENEYNAENERNKSLIHVDNERNKSLIHVDNERNKSLMDAGNERNKSLMEDENDKNTSFMEDENEKNASFMEDENEKNASCMEDENENTNLMEDESENNISYIEDENDKNTSLKDAENNNTFFDTKKAFLDSVSFSDTFDFFSENGENTSSKVPNEIPLFIDLEPLHFSQPPRRSYAKTKNAICFNTSRGDSENECSEEDVDEPKKKRKKTSRLNKEEQKRMQQWIKSVNETFSEIDQFNLTVE